MTMPAALRTLCNGARRLTGNIPVPPNITLTFESAEHCQLFTSTLEINDAQQLLAASMHSGYVDFAGVFIRVAIAR